MQIYLMVNALYDISCFKAIYLLWHLPIIEMIGQVARPSLRPESSVSISSAYWNTRSYWIFILPTNEEINFNLNSQEVKNIGFIMVYGLIEGHIAHMKYMWPLSVIASHQGIFQCLENCLIVIHLPINDWKHKGEKSALRLLLPWC